MNKEMFLTFSICCFMLLLTFMYIQTLSSLRSIMLALLFSCKVVSDSFVTPWTIACQAPLSMGFPRQESWSRLPFSSPVLGYTLPSPHHIMCACTHTHTHTHTHTIPMVGGRYQNIFVEYLIKCRIVGNQNDTHLEYGASTSLIQSTNIYWAL